MINKPNPFFQPISALSVIRRINIIVLFASLSIQIQIQIEQFLRENTRLTISDKTAILHARQKYT